MGQSVPAKEPSALLGNRAGRSLDGPGPKTRSRADRCADELLRGWLFRGEVRVLRGNPGKDWKQNRHRISRLISRTISDGVALWFRDNSGRATVTEDRQHPQSARERMTNYYGYP